MLQSVPGKFIKKYFLEDVNGGVVKLANIDVRKIENNMAPMNVALQLK